MRKLLNYTMTRVFLYFTLFFVKFININYYSLRMFIKKQCENWSKTFDTVNSKPETYNVKPSKSSKIFMNFNKISSQYIEI